MPVDLVMLRLGARPSVTGYLISHITVLGKDVFCAFEGVCLSFWIDMYPPPSEWRGRFNCEGVNAYVGHTGDCKGIEVRCYILTGNSCYQVSRGVETRLKGPVYGLESLGAVVKASEEMENRILGRLQANGEPVHSERTPLLETFWVKSKRVGFEGGLDPGRPTPGPVENPDDTFELGIYKVRGSAATKVDGIEWSRI